MGKYLCSPYYQNKENFKRPSNGAVSHKLWGCSTTGHFLPMSSYELLINVAESVIVLNCSVVTKWIPTFWHDKAQQLFFGDQPFDEPVHLQQHRPKSEAGFDHRHWPTAGQHRKTAFGEDSACVTRCWRTQSCQLCSATPTDGNWGWSWQSVPSSWKTVPRMLTLECGSFDLKVPGELWFGQTCETGDLI